MAAAIPWLVAAAAGGSAILGAGAARAAGQAQQDQYKAQARQEQDASRQREIERKRDLLKALSNQNAVVGAQGVSMTGSKAATAWKDINYAADDLLYDKANTKRSVGVLRTAGINARRQGDMAAVASLLDFGVQAYGAFGGGGGAKPPKSGTASTTGTKSATGNWSGPR